MISEQKKMSRLEELELNQEFQKLPDDKKIILIAGEKILEMNECLKNFFFNLENFAMENFDAQLFKENLMQDILSKIQDQLNSSNNLQKEDVIQLIDKRYFEEISSLESKFQFITENTINSVNETFGDALQTVESLNLFQVQAREEIRKNQDKIYILEEQLSRQKEQNDYLRDEITNKIQEFENLMRNVKDNVFLDSDSPDRKFNSFSELEKHIFDKAEIMIDEKIEEYLINDGSSSSNFGFTDIENDDEINELLFDLRNSKSEILKVYETQIENGNKLTKLEKLIDFQSDQIRKLSEDRKDFVFLIADLIKNKKFTSEEFLKRIDFDGNLVEQELNKDIEKNVLETLKNDEINLLINDQAIDLFKKKIDELNKYEENEEEFFEDEDSFGNIDFLFEEFKDENDYSGKIDINYSEIEKGLSELKKLSEENKKANTQLDEVNLMIEQLQEQLKIQTIENENLRNELFEEIAKNASYARNSDIIKQDNFAQYFDEEDMKHNYYNGNMPIPGTKITRINNYRINNDMDNITYEETQEIIKQESVTTPNVVESKTEETQWEQENQKIIDLENIVQRQEEEINRLKKIEEEKKQFSKDEIERLVKEETLKVVVKESSSDKIESNKQKEFINSLEQTLSQLKKLSEVQAKTVADLERQSRKLEEVEQKVKNSTKNNQLIDVSSLDEIIEQKYNKTRKEDNYANGLKKIEDERRKIEETLELERLRLLTEINLGTKKLNDLQENKPQQVIIQTPIIQQQPESVVALATPEPAPVVKKGFFGRLSNSSSSNEQPLTVNGEPKKKRRQQIFYEVKVHTTPKLTRADLEK